MPILEALSNSFAERSCPVDTPSTAPFLEGCSNFSIEGSHFNIVYGSQHNTIYHGDVTVHQVGKRRLTVWDEFTRVPTGQVYVTKTWCTRDVRDDPDYDQRMRRDIDAQRTINTARIGNSEYLHIAYSGTDASEAHQKDFEEFSRVRNAHTIQLFGYSRMAIPALIFYDGLVPVSFVWERNGFSPALYTYFSYLADQLGQYLRLRELWIDPSTGTLRKGPYVADSADHDYNTVKFRAALTPSDHRHSLTLQDYNNANAINEYLFQFLSVRNILPGVYASGKHGYEQANNANTIYFLLASLPGTIYNKASRQIVARWSGAKERWCYGRCRNLPRIAQERMVMEDGSVRFTFALSDMQNFQEFGLQCILLPAGEWIDFAETWLSLAHHIFHHLGIQREEWKEHSILNSFMLYYECEKQRLSPKGFTDLPADTRVYLFLRPIPRPSDDWNTWNVWVNRMNHIWSFDPSGKGEISDVESERLGLGLPSLTVSIRARFRWWDNVHYDSVQMLHNFKGFNPTSDDLARSLGLPYDQVEIINPDADRFQEIEDDHAMRWHINYEPMSVDVHQGQDDMNVDEKQPSDAMEVD